MNDLQMNSNLPSINLESLEELCDVEICGRDEVIEAESCNSHASDDSSAYTRFHSLALAVHSDFFRNFLRTQSGEYDDVLRVRRFDGPRTKIKLFNVTQKNIRRIREFIYNGSIAGIDFEMAQELIEVSNELGMSKLQSYVANIIGSGMSEENAIGIYKFAEAYSVPGLTNRAHRYLLSKIWRIAHSKDWTEFAQLKYNLLAALLSNDRLNAPRESALIDLIAKWVRGDPESRMLSAARLVENIRVGLLNPAGRRYILEQAAVLGEEVLRALEAHLLKVASLSTGQIRIDLPLCRPRIPTDVIFCFGGWSSGAPTSKVEVFDPKVGMWFECPFVDHTPRAYHGVVVLSDCFYIVAGYDAVEYFCSVRKFDPKTCMWTEVAPMHSRRCYVNTVILDGHIYAVGGFDGHRRFNTVEKYNPLTNQWSFVQPMQLVRSDTSAAVLSGHIYVAGGFDGQVVTASMERYSPATGQWTMMRDMLVPRSGTCMAVHGDYLYVLGGFDGHERLNTIERYDPKTNTWKLLKEMHSQRSNFSIAVLHDYIYVAGGFNGQRTIPEVERYDITLNVWQNVEPMLFDRSALKICAFEGMEHAERFTFYGRMRHMPPPSLSQQPTAMPIVQPMDLEGDMGEENL